MSPDPNEERDRGILTKRERRYLRGDEGIEKGSADERAIRASIRNHLTNAVLDFELVNEKFEERDIQQVREFVRDGKPITQPFLHADGNVTNEAELDPDISDGLVEMIAFIFRINPGQWYIESVVEHGVERAIARLDQDAEVGDVSIPIEVPEKIGDRVDRYMEEGEIPLSDTEIRVALEQDVRPPDEVAKYVKEHGTRQEGLNQQALRNLSEDMEKMKNKYGSEDE